MITPERLDSWRRLAACDALAGAPLGDALEAACNEIVDLECKLAQAVTPGTATLAALVTAEADRDRARDAAVALEQQLAAVRALHDERKIREHDPVSGYETGNWWPSICGACSDPAVIETLEIGELIEEGQGQRWPCPTVAIIDGGEES